MISKQDIKKLSELARIEIRESEMEKLQHDLERVLEYVDQLTRAETGAAKMVAGATELSNVFVPDGARVAVSADATELFSAAPRHEQSFVKVPSVWKKK